jgi:hypothetical protein
MQPVWDEAQIAKLIALGRAGEPWRWIGKDFGIHSESARRRWASFSTEEDRAERQMQLSQPRPEVKPKQLADFPPGTNFPDDPAACQPDIGSRPVRPVTWVPYLSGSGWAVR